MKKDERIILIDADVVSHFISAGEMISIKAIFDIEVYILNKVYDELQKFPKRKLEVDNLLTLGIVKLLPFPEESEQIKKEYTYIKKNLFKGDGEAASLSVARFTNNILASSNLKDIAEYCKMHKIDYLTTMDFLCEAFKKGLFDISRCNSFITKVLNARSKLPVTKMEDYQCKPLNF